MEFAKHCEINFAAPRPQFIINQDQSRVDRAKFVVLNQKLTREHIKSVSETFPRISKPMKQIVLANTALTSAQFATLLDSLSLIQTQELKSIIYVGSNHFGKEVQEVICKKYLKKRGLSTLTQLKLVGCSTD